MDSIDKKLEDFFRKYETIFNESLAGTIDIEETVNSFSDGFIEANPFGVLCGKNDEQFRTALTQGYEFYKLIGTKSMNIGSIEVSSLDKYHSMVKVHWHSVYNRKDGREEQIEFDVIYFVQTIDKNPKIFAYITGDEQGILREKGLIP